LCSSEPEVLGKEKLAVGYSTTMVFKLQSFVILNGNLGLKSNI